MAFTIITMSAFAQNLPKAGYSGLGFSITGLSNVIFSNFGSTAISGAVIQDPLGVLGGYPVTLDNLIPQSTIMYKRYYENGLASRFSIGVNSLSSTTFAGDSTGIVLEYAESEQKISGFSFGLGAGLEKHIETTASKVDPFLGAEVMFAMLSGVKSTTTVDVNSENSTSNYINDVVYPGGIGFSLNLLGGFNYFFSDNISIGGEVGLGFDMMNSGGEWTSDAEYNYTSGGTTTTTLSSSRGEYHNNTSGFNVNSYGGVNLIVYW